jgi:hypothetical protein
MFPKDYEIDMQMLIHLWMANGFIPEQSKVCPETFGERIFYELKSRSFFQDLKNVPFDKKYYIYEHDDKRRYCSRITCKIHDLMHDVAQSAMEEECAAIATHPSERGVLRSVRHLFLSIHRPETLLNASQDKGSPGFQTLVCERNVEGDMKILSKYNSIRALKINHDSFFIRPKYLHHLRYLDLSRSGIKALPEDISILFHLQTLNLSNCRSLVQFPKGLKYLTALRHLYTHGCLGLESMPTELGHLTSLQTLTYFVAGTDSSCCNVSELQNLDLGGKLDLSQLENVKGADARAARLGNKKKLTELELCWSWTDSDQEAQNNNHREVMEDLKPHDGLKALVINGCRSSTFPAWMSTLRGLVELFLFGCKELEKLPALWQLPALQILHLRELHSLHCLCSGGTTSVTFPELKVIILSGMAKFETWWETHEVQGEEPIFPKVEVLKIERCKSLTALPKAALVISRVDSKCCSAFPALRKMRLHDLAMFDRWVAVEETIEEEVAFPQLEELSIVSCGSLSALPKGSLLAKQSFGEVETVCIRSAFPALRELKLSELPALERWGAIEGTIGEEATFPQLEELSIWSCRRLSALPKGSFFAKQSFGEVETVCRRSAFPSLRNLELSDLSSLRGWGPVEGSPGEEVAYPRLENLRITGCPELTDLPEAPKLSELSIGKGWGQQQISLVAASKCIPSLSRLNLDVSPGDTETTLLHVKNKWNGTLALPAMWLDRCDLFFSSHSSALALWTCFAQLVDLTIRSCYNLVYWPENVFQVLVCLRSLSIHVCSKLTGRTQASDEQSGPAPERCGILPCLESLKIKGCESLVKVPNLPASLKTLHIKRCGNLKSIVFGQEDTRLVSGEGVVQQDTSSLIPGSSSSEATASTTVLKLSSAANHRLLPFPCLESLNIQQCDGLSDVANLPPSIKTLGIRECRNLQSVSGQLDDIQKLTIGNCCSLESLEPCLGDIRSLEDLKLYGCGRLVSLPDGPQAYSSLRVIWIKDCDGIKLLPPSLQSRLGYLEEKDLDARFEGKL